MSWFRKLIGEAEQVAKTAEEAIKREGTMVNKAFASVEAGIAYDIKSAFSKSPLAKTHSIGVHIDSQGHFDEYGQGNAVIKIEAQAMPLPEPIAAPIAEPTPEPKPPGEEPPTP
jgi:hypothetical protein